MKFNSDLIIPNLSTVDRDALTSVDSGAVIFNTTELQFEYWDGTQWVTCTSPENIDPGDIGGGASSMVMSFASGSIKHVETTSGGYASLAHFIYGGSDAVGDIVNINVNAWNSAAGTTAVRLYDLTNAQVIAELTGINTNSEANVQSMGTITNLPTLPAVIEVQGRRVTGPGASKLLIASLELQY
jgi:hypothetical protein